MRLLTQCNQCRQQYDVSGMAPGAAMRCRCGAMLSVPHPRAQQARLVRCASCGAVRGKGGDNCEFCGARFSLADKGWGSMCPSCYVRLPNDARFCVECGIKINPIVLNAPVSDKRCPRCACNLNPRVLDKLTLDECPACAGIWLNSDAFAAVCKDKEVQSAGVAGTVRRGRMKFELSSDECVKYVPCPQCRELMNRRNFAMMSGVIIDVCKDHGVWLDNQELNRIVQFIESGGMERLREREVTDAVHRIKMASKSSQSGGASLPLGGGGGAFFSQPGRPGVAENLVGDFVVGLISDLFK